MADEGIHKQVFNVRNVTTRSVTLYPSRAHIVREINDVTLKVGDACFLGQTLYSSLESRRMDVKSPSTSRFQQPIQFSCYPRRRD